MRSATHGTAAAESVLSHLQVLASAVMRQALVVLAVTFAAYEKTTPPETDDPFAPPPPGVIFTLPAQWARRRRALQPSHVTSTKP